MHELALCGSIARIVDTHARGRRVETVRVRVGELRQVVPDTLIYCWAMVTDTTPLGGATLEVDRVAARIRCADCGIERDLGVELDLRCAACAGRVEVIAGEEFLVTSIDVAAPTGAAT